VGHVIDIYQGHDPAELPMYSVTAVAHYLGVPRSTITSWAKGHSKFKRVFSPAQTSPLRLSFLNLIEVYVLEALRRGPQRDGDGMRLPEVRDALRQLEILKGPESHPLATNRFSTDGVRMYTDHLGQLWNLSSRNQIEMREVIGRYLQHIEYDARGQAFSLQPARIGRDDRDAEHVRIAPRVAFGRPVVRGTGVPTRELANRRQAGDTPAFLARDFHLSEDDVVAALRWELGQEAA
jgi:uncharacterized protein (DUF433 family)